MKKENINYEKAVEEIIKCSFRYKSILSLPSGGSNTLNTIEDCISFIKLHNPTTDVFDDWFSTKFVVCRKSCYNSRKILERANVILIRNKKNIDLTVDLLKYWDKELNIFLARSFMDAYEGMWEIIYLLIKKRSILFNELYENWFKQYDGVFCSNRNKKTSYEQFGIMTRYLRNFGLIGFDDDKCMVLSLNMLNKIILLT